MRILVTRPARSAHKTIKRLAGLGHEPVALPLFVAIVNEAAVSAAISEPTSGYIFTSAEGVRALETAKPLPEAMLAKPVFTVGEKTAGAARAAGFQNVSSGGGDGAMLANLIATSAKNQAEPFVYLAGEPRSPLLETKLAEADIRFRTFACYRMAETDLPQQKIENIFRAGIDCVLLYSAETAKRFFALIDQACLSQGLKNARFLCLSPAIAAIVPRQFAPHIAIAKTPSEDNLFDLL